MNTIKGEHKLTHNSCYCNFPEKCDIHERYTWLRRKKGAHPICRPQSLIKLNLTKACYIWDCNGGGGGGGGLFLCIGGLVYCKPSAHCLTTMCITFLSCTRFLRKGCGHRRIKVEMRRCLQAVGVTFTS